MGKIARRMELEACVAELVEPDSVVGLGGLHFHNMPMALVRELIRQEVPVGRLVPSIDGSIDADLLIGAGLVREVQVAYLGLETYGLAPRFRAAAEAGTVRVRDCEEAGFGLALAAGAAGLPFAALPAGFMPADEGLPSVPAVNRDDYREIENPFTGERHMLIQAINPDVALIHCQAIDAHGNCGFFGGSFLDVELAKSARICIVQVEREYEELPSACRRRLPGYAVDAYCVVEGGAHPGSSHGVYRHDDVHLRRYAQLARSDHGFERYRGEMIGVSEAEYAAASRLDDRIEALEAGPVG
ncbi:MAG TPA: CoA-transferase [Solirubrobacterales bacterium]|nr:CoA-transferase [Solirubrobacterales bacterium]